jgi:hypothetical protein
MAWTIRSALGLIPSSCTKDLSILIVEAALVRHWTLADADLAVVERRRGGHNQLGYALQLCAFRYPGRLLRPGEAIQETALNFVANQLVSAPTFSPHMRQGPTRAANNLTGCGSRSASICMARPWPGAAGLAVARGVGLDERCHCRREADGRTAPAQDRRPRFERRRTIGHRRPGRGRAPRRRTAHPQPVLRTDRSSGRSARVQGGRIDECAGLDAAATRRAGPQALKRIVAQLAHLRTVGLDPAAAEGVQPERLRKLAREGACFTAQHLRAPSPLRRRSTLVATVPDTMARLIDAGVVLFDRAVGRMFRRAEAREENAVLRDARAGSSSSLVPP